MKFDVRNTAHVKLPDIDRAGASYMAVLVKTMVGDKYAAYEGLVQFPHTPGHRLYDKARDIKAQRVATLGSRMEFAAAKVHFPAIKRSQYDDRST